MGGSFLGKAMDENMKKTQEFMTENQVVMLGRQMQMQNAMREKAAAMQIASSRELLVWFGSFYSIAALGMIGGFRKTKRPAVIAPLLPLTFILAYQVDLCYGSKLDRIRAEAESILDNDFKLIGIPKGLPSVELLDERRKSE